MLLVKTVAKTLLVLGLTYIAMAASPLKSHASTKVGDGQGPQTEPSIQ